MMTGLANAPMRVQYGCGLSAPCGWRNFDASPTLRLQRIFLLGKLLTRGRVVFPSNVEYGDVRKRLPVASLACATVYCSHVLEHLSLDDLRKALRETHRILAPGGVFRGVLPDLECCVRRYLADASPNAACRFMEETSLGSHSRELGIRGLAETLLGNSRHLWMWDFKALELELVAAGLVGVRRAEFGDSADAAFRALEEKGRWQDCLGFECRRERDKQ